MGFVAYWARLSSLRCVSGGWTDVHVASRGFVAHGAHLSSLRPVDGSWIDAIVPA